MISRLLPLALFVAACAPGLLHAQAGPQFPSGPQFYLYNTGKFPALYDSTNYDKMYEDIEVMRRILDRQLQPLYPSFTYETFGMVGMGGMGGMRGMSPGMPGMPPGTGGGGGMYGFQGRMMGNFQGGMGMAGGTTTVVHHLRSLEGVYLKGQGVVYTATLSSLQPPSKTAKTEAAKPVSEWESVRRQVRNEKEEPKKAEAAKPPTLSDVLLKVLAENGHHFSQLGENESLTIVITVHQADSSSSSRKSKGGGGSGGSPRGSGDSPKKASPKPKSGGGSDLPGKVSDLELLGDLHLKQGKYDDAIVALKKALDMTKSPKRKAELCCKLAQCYLMLQDPVNAHVVIELAIALMEKETDARNKPAPSEKPAAELPVKLIISAPKKLLDQVKEGKIPFEEFRRQARVETLRIDDRR